MSNLYIYNLNIIYSLMTWVVQVYRATIDGVQEVAVKVFHDVHNTMQQADILREVAILKSCRDRNIVQFLGACIMVRSGRLLSITHIFFCCLSCSLSFPI